ncbi:MAG: hypothetical protein FJW34_02240 [Acidobacteria bacterium]|nr:hypothetical protein [Acidobacteriota bacterium]
MFRTLAICLALALGALSGFAAEEPKFVSVKHYRFSTVDKDAQMWSALYVGSNGKLYIGLCTHADAANVYEFDPQTEIMRHLANLTELNEERGKAIWTNGKIHVQMQELDGYVYFGSLSEDNGPPAIDAASYKGPRWYRIEMKTGKVEQLSLINSFWGLLGQTMDVKRRVIYGLAENGHLYKYYIDKDWTEDLGRVDEWDVCRTIFTDDLGNVYGSYPPGRIWKYDPRQDRIFDFEHIRLPLINQSRSMANPMLDRKAQWRIIEWDPVDRAAYGIIGGSNLLFKYDPHRGPEGAVTPLVSMAAPGVRNGDPMNLPYATLAMAISQKERKVYYLTVMAGDFDYGAVTKDVMGSSFLVTYDLRSGRREDLGVLRTTDGRTASGMGGAKVDQNGRLWFVGAFSEPDPRYQVGRGRRPYSMGLGCYDPLRK